MTEIYSAFVLGVLGTGHCLGMCGGITAALAFACSDSRGARRLLILLGYNLGRISSYTLMGILFALIFGSVEKLTPLPLLRTASGILLIGMGLYLAGWWKILTRLEALGSRLWRYIAPYGQKLMPVKSPGKAILLGAVWGWLPCGLVYTALALAATQPDAARGGMVMLAFGLGTLPAVLAGGLASDVIKHIVGQRWLAIAFGVVFIVYGLYTLKPVVMMGLYSAGFVEQPMEHMHHHH